LARVSSAPAILLTFGVRDGEGEVSPLSLVQHHVLRVLGDAADHSFEPFGHAGGAARRLRGCVCGGVPAVVLLGEIGHHRMRRHDCDEREF